MKLDNVILKPIITEKSLNEASFGRYTFLVARDANKIEIKKAIANLFKVNPVNVYTNITKGTKNVRTKYAVKKHKFMYKKARVTLAQDQKIDIFEELVSK